MGSQRQVRAVACLEVGWRCRFVARGYSPQDAEQRFWLHARGVHGRQLEVRSPREKAKISDLVEALSQSRRKPLHKRPATSPGLRELEETGVVRRWWC